MQARPLDYFCAPDIGTSDHKPVGCTFSVPTVWRQVGIIRPAQNSTEIQWKNDVGHRGGIGFYPPPVLQRGASMGT